MSNLIYTEHKCEVSDILNSTSLLYGMSAFEGIISIFSKEDNVFIIFRLHEHIERLLSSYSYFANKNTEINFKFIYDSCINALKKSIINNDDSNIYIRPTIIKGYNNLNVNLSGGDDKLFVITEKIPIKEHHTPLLVKTSSLKKPSDNSFPNKAKLGGAYINILLSRQLLELPYNDVLMLNEHNNICEIGTSNIFFSKNNTIYTPSLSCSILPGITRDSVIKICKHLNINVIEKECTYNELTSADEIFATGTLMGVNPVIKVDNYDFNVGNFYLLINKLYSEIQLGKNNHFKNWLTYIAQKDD